MSMQVEKTSVVLEGAESVDAAVLLGSGKLTVSGGAEALMEGTFTYADAMWKPVVDYTVEAGVGKLNVRQPHLEVPAIGSPKYVWDLMLGDGAPVDLSVKVGSGSVDLTMAGTRLKALDVAAASGPVRADLTGDLPDLTRVSIKSASGHSTVIMDGVYPLLETIDIGTASGPTDVSLAGDFPALRKLKIGSASGKVNVVLGGQYGSLEKISINLASGPVDLDVSGFTMTNTEIKVNTVSGVGTVVVPAGAPVVLRYNAVSGRVDAPGFSRVGKTYVNAAAAEGGTESVLRLKVSTVSGRLKVLTPAEA